MELSSDQQVIINKLYSIYESKGFIREEEALDLMTAHDVSLVNTERLIGILLGLGVIFADDGTSDEDDDIDDKAQTDYEAIFNEVLLISPGQQMLIDYIRGIRPPQRREWINLMPQAKSGNQYAYNRLFEMYLRVVLRISLNSYKNNGYELDELLHEGALGLMRAIRAYDSNKHGTFVSYLPLWIKQHIDRAIIDKGPLIRIPAHMHETMTKLETTADKLEAIDGRLPDVATIATEMGITLNEVERIRSWFYEFESIEEHLNIHSDGFTEYNVKDMNEGGISDDFENLFLREAIISALNGLSKRQAFVLRLRFGIDDGCERTLEEIGAILDVTRERIRQIESKGLIKLRHPARSKRLKDYLDNA